MCEARSNTLDTYYQGEKGDNHGWDLHFTKYHFENETEVSSLINKLIRVCSSGDLTKNIYRGFKSQGSSLIRLMQSQHLFKVRKETERMSNRSRHHFVLHYIQEHLTEKIPIDTLSRKAYLSRNMFFKWFKQQFGLTPLEYVNPGKDSGGQATPGRTQASSISDISFQCAAFPTSIILCASSRKSEGITPGAYRMACQGKKSE